MMHGVALAVPSRYTRLMSEFRSVRNELLNIDLETFAKLEKMFQDFPRSARRAVAQVLNDIAFNARVKVNDIFRAHGMIVRNARFNTSRMRVDKAKGNVAVALIESRVGSIRTAGLSGRAGHDGWLSLMKGSPSRNRVTSLMSRGDSKSGKVKSYARLKGDFPAPNSFDDARGGTKLNRLEAMLRIMAYETGEKQFVVREKEYGLSPGLYRIASKRGYFSKKYRRAKGRGKGKMREYPRVRMLQRFGKRPKGQRINWIGELIKLAVKTTDYDAEWKAAMERETSRMKP